MLSKLKLQECLQAPCFECILSNLDKIKNKIIYYCDFEKRKFEAKPSSTLGYDKLNETTLNINQPGDIELETLNSNRDNCDELSPSTLPPLIPTSSLPSVPSLPSLPSLPAPFPSLILASFDELRSKMDENILSYDLAFQEKEKDSKLRIWVKTLSLESKQKINVIITEWFLPFSAQKYSVMLNDIKEAKKIDEKFLEFYDILEEGKEGKVVHARYKKVLTASPREFIYLKGTMGEGQKIIEVSKSIDYPSHPVIPEIVRAEMLLSGTIIEDIKKEDYNFKSDEFNNSAKICKIKTYSEVDLKWVLPAFVTKPFAVMEIKKYTEKCLGRMKELEGVL